MVPPACKQKQGGNSAISQEELLLFILLRLQEWIMGTGSQLCRSKSYVCKSGTDCVNKAKSR